MVTIEDRAESVVPAIQGRASGAELFDIADLVDDVCAKRAELNPAADIDEPELRCILFDLLDSPAPCAWLKHREFEVFPRFLDGLSEPSPIGLTLADLIYDYGLSDETCPSREDLMHALRWSLTESAAE